MIEEILDEGHLDDILDGYVDRPLLLFESDCQSADCNAFYSVVKEFLERNPSVDCLLIDASEKKSLASYLEEKSSFPFSPPQVLYYMNGKFVGRLGEEALTVEELEKAYHALI